MMIGGEGQGHVWTGWTDRVLRVNVKFSKYYSVAQDKIPLYCLALVLWY